MSQNNKDKRDWISPEVVSQWADNQAKELLIREKETDHQANESKNNHEIAKLSIGAQLEDNKQQRALQENWHKRLTCLIGFSIAGSILLIAFAFYLGKEDTIMDLAAIIAIGVGAFLSGKNMGPRS